MRLENPQEYLALTMNVWRISENGYDKQTAPGCRHGLYFG